MRVAVILTVTMTILGSAMVYANAKVIYGDDNRMEVYQASPSLQLLARSSAAMIEKAKISVSEEQIGMSKIDQRSLRTWLEDQSLDKSNKRLFSSQDDKPVSFCANEIFVDQPNAAMCSGFLIGPDIMVTAGHCAVLANFCDGYSWVFDYKIDVETQTAGTSVKNEDIYSCKRLISTTLNGAGLDYAVIQLDRVVQGREPLTVRTQNKISVGEGLVVIGNPSGLPLKVADGASVRSSTNPLYFTANLDTFQGNSGSAVFNAETGVVEGILVRGENDYVMNSDLMCVESNRCANDECRGEDVTRMTSVPEIFFGPRLALAATSGDEEALIEILRNDFWVDFYGKDRVTALMRASEAGKNISVKMLLSKGADVSLVDLEGNTSLHYLAATLNDESIDVLEILLTAHSDLEAINNFGETPMLKAAANSNLEAVEILIGAGADKNAVDNNGETALFAFMRMGDFEAVRTLIKLGVNPSILNNQGLGVMELEDKSVKKLGKII